MRRHTETGTGNPVRSGARKLNWVQFENTRTTAKAHSLKILNDAHIKTSETRTNATPRADSINVLLICDSL
jgi:hypothetical protein